MDPRGLGDDGVESRHAAAKRPKRRVLDEQGAQVVDELEQLGYVERRADPDDRRARLVFLTKRGEAVRPVAMAASRRVEARWSKLMGKSKLESLRRSLQDLLTLIDAARTPERGTRNQ